MSKMSVSWLLRWISLVKEKKVLFLFAHPGKSILVVNAEIKIVDTVFEENQILKPRENPLNIILIEKDPATNPGCQDRSYEKHPSTQLISCGVVIFYWILPLGIKIGLIIMSPKIKGNISVIESKW